MLDWDGNGAQQYGFRFIEDIEVDSFGNVVIKAFEPDETGDSNSEHFEMTVIVHATGLLFLTNIVSSDKI